MINKKNVIEFPIIILIILLTLLAFIYLYDLNDATVKNKSLESPVQDFISIESDTSNAIYIDENLVIGVINIAKLDIIYPIIEYIDENSLNISICKYSETEINKEGNLCLLGHNMRNGTFFSKLYKLETGDIIELTDSTRNTLNYKVYDKYYINPEDIEIFNQNSKDIKEVTLITCNDTSSKRLIIKLKEVKE